MYTIIGSTGFIGSALVEYLKNQGITCFTPARDDTSIFSQPLGNVIYAAGYTSDFRSKVLETVEAHVCALREFIARATFDSLLYLSSTRVYKRSVVTVENIPVFVSSSDPDDIYGISKLMGESLVLNTAKAPMRVVRISNVYGTNMDPQTFLGSLIQEATEKKEILLKSALSSTKDYIFVKDLRPLLMNIAKKGKERIYNLASGYNLTTEKIVKQLVLLTGCTFNVSPDAPKFHFPEIRIERIQK